MVKMNLRTRFRAMVAFFILIFIAILVYHYFYGHFLKTKPKDGFGPNGSQFNYVSSFLANSVNNLIQLR